jgi:hypothetical protein
VVVEREYAHLVSAKYGVEWVVQVAINAIDKPSGADPESSLQRILESDGPEVFEAALAKVRVRELLALNAHDFVAAGAERLLSNVLAEGTVVS